jgi:very-short-patch-repair endonuclease
MNKEELLHFIENNRENFGVQLKRLYPNVYNEINSIYQGSTFGEKMYQHINETGTGICEVCNGPTIFNSYYKGYRKTCSYKCLNSKKIIAPIIKSCPICRELFETDKRHNRVTCSTACQNEYTNLPEFKSKVQSSLKKTIKEKYGVSHSSQIPGFALKSKATKKAKYGDENFVNPEKASQTKLEKYGNKNYNNLEKLKSTLLEKYGVENISKLEEFVKKSNDTKFAHFGEQMTSDFAIKSIMERLQNGTLGYQSAAAKQTIREKYGVEHVSQNKNVAAQISSTNIDKFYYSIVSGSRLDGQAVPLFTREEYKGTRGINDEQLFYKFKCTSCDVCFDAVLEDGKVPKCQRCYPSVRSRPELEILEFLKEHLPIDCEIKQNDRQLISPLELDFYIPSKNVAIEFDGIVWHSEFFGEKEKKYHIHKTKMAADKGVKLIHIFENEWVVSKNIVKRKILNLIGSNKIISESHSTINKSIFARKCKILEIESDVCSKFLQTYHIQGTDRSTVKLGAFFENTLVAVMTFGKGRVALGTKHSKQDEYEMYRFAVGETPVIGIGGKLLTYFIENYKPEKITTFADIRYSGMRAFYEKIGFSFAGITSPNYWYFNMSDPYKLVHRFGFQKGVLHKKLPIFDASITEWENMKNNGFDRIWDCGNLKYIWTNPKL